MTTSALALDRTDDRLLPAAYWTLRAGAALCFIGHGAFGFITKAAWLPYFAVVGMPEGWAWRLMPMVGAVDVLAGMAVLFAPRALPLAYMAAWALWTALLRPLAGEPVWETVERAGNYGVPFALLVLTGALRRPRSLAEAWRESGPALDDATTLARVALVLRWTTALLLLGHGALGVAAKPGLTAHWAVVGMPPETTVLAGWMEIALAAAVLLRPAPALLVLAAAWKLATESLWMPAGAPVWEFVERAGSYAAPLALAALTIRTASGTRRSPSAPAAR